MSIFPLQIIKRPEVSLNLSKYGFYRVELGTAGYFKYYLSKLLLKPNNKLKILKKENLKKTKLPF